jgi:DNA gyrase subunit A
MVQRTTVRGINRYGRASQGVRVMNLRDDDVVSAVALVVDNGERTAAPVADDGSAPLASDGASPDGAQAGPEAQAEPEAKAGGEADEPAPSSGGNGAEADA